MNSSAECSLQLGHRWFEVYDPGAGNPNPGRWNCSRGFLRVQFVRGECLNINGPFHETFVLLSAFLQLGEGTGSLERLLIFANLRTQTTTTTTVTTTTTTTTTVTVWHSVCYIFPAQRQPVLSWFQELQIVLHLTSSATAIYHFLVLQNSFGRQKPESYTIFNIQKKARFCLRFEFSRFCLFKTTPFSSFSG